MSNLALPQFIVRAVSKRDLLPRSALRAWPQGRWRRFAWWLGGCLAAFAILGFLVLPPLVRPYLERKISAALDRKVTIGKLRINPFTLSATLGDISVAERAEGPPMLTLAELHLDGELSSLFRWAPVLNALKLAQPRLHLTRFPDERYNFSDLVDRALAGPPGPPPRFAVGNIEIVDGEIDFDDRPTGRRHRITQVQLGIPFLSTVPSQTEIKVEPRFSAHVNGRPVSISGETRPFKDTHETVLHWDINGLPLPAYIAYLPSKPPFNVDSGAVDATIDARFVSRGGKPPQLTVSGSLKVGDLSLSERSGTPIVRIPSLAIAIEGFDVFGRSANVRSIVADGPELDLRRDLQGGLNLAALFPAADSTPGSGPSFGFRVGSIAVNHGTVRLADAAVRPPFTSTLGDVSVGIMDLLSSGERNGEVTFSFTSDTGAHVAHRGMFALAPFRTEGRMELSGLRLARLFPYYAGALNLAVDDGTLDGTTNVRFDGKDATLALTNLEATARKLKLRVADDREALWRMPELTVRGGSVDVGKHAIVFDAIEARGAEASIRRAADGGFNFERLVRARPEGTAAAGESETWSVLANRVAMDDFAGTFTDETVSPPARIALSRVSLKGENISSSGNAKGNVRLQATVNKRGTISAAGSIMPAPFAASLDVQANAIELVPFQAYVSRSARVIVTGGNVSVKGAAEISASTPARGAFKGEVVVRELAALDEGNQSDLLKWKTLRVGGIEAQLEPLAVAVEEVAVDDLFARLLLNENGEFNLQQLARTEASAPEPPTAMSWFRLGKAKLANGSIDFTDHFIRPNYSAKLTGLTGSLSALASDKPADIDVRGNVQGTAPLEISGRINPLGPNLFLDVKASATDIELPPLSPYSGKYVGYGIEKGKLSMKVSYQVDNRKLKAQNSIVLDQLTFGEKVESPDAINAPVQFAVSLLKDADGVIRFDLPVGGSLDDPDFSVGGLVFRAIVGLVVKIVTAPFAALGSLSGHGEELAYIEFAPGSAALDKAGEEKVKAVAKALADRPALRLDVAGRVDPVADREALKRSTVEREVKQQKFKDLVASGAPPASVEAVEVPPSEYEALLKRAYRAGDFSKPRNLIGIPKDLPREEMEALLLANAAASDEDLRSLANRRAQAVLAHFTGVERVTSDRVFVTAPHLDAEGLKDKGKPTRVDFALH
jgi:hypothetical protein